MNSEVILLPVAVEKFILKKIFMIIIRLKSIFSMDIHMIYYFVIFYEDKLFFCIPKKMDFIALSVSNLPKLGNRF